MKGLIIIGCLLLAQISAWAQKPNIVFILTDDQGYGDLACHGNPYIKTPHLDQLYSKSVRFTDYHVATTCAPSRAGLLTGRNCNKVGVWHTIIGREILRRNEVTMAEVFRNAGYATGIFGKWHLGDNYPYRPQDRGFDEVLMHGGGGVGQTPDYWENDYFDDTYIHNGKPQKYPGYCTDVWFEEATGFIVKNKKKPFFCYISNNAPHSPYNVADKYSDPYKNNPGIPNPNFYGMITSIDERVGILVERLKKEGLYENTIFIFMTDNGTAAGVRFDAAGNVAAGFNAEMRGTKGTPYEGGHRVPFFLHWPKGGFNKGQDVKKLTSYVDVLPTLISLSGISKPKSLAFDGIDLRPVMKGATKNWKDRLLVSDVQRGENLEKWKQSSVMTQQWRLINGSDLYDIQTDKGQRNNVAAANPEVVARLRAGYEEWWKDISVNADVYSRVPVGAAAEKVTVLTAHDLHAAKDFPAWNQDMVRAAIGVNGYWALEVSQGGRYQIELRRYPAESDLGLSAVAPAGEAVPGGKPYAAGKPILVRKGKIQVGDKSFEKDVAGNEKTVSFTTDLPAGPLNLSAALLDDTGKAFCAYYVYIKPI